MVAESLNTNLSPFFRMVPENIFVFSLDCCCIAVGGEVPATALGTAAKTSSAPATISMNLFIRHLSNDLWLDECQGARSMPEGAKL